ncbi:hypothetical protein [Trebonia sp.]|uniref:hypothetical protein n=1 Tax=Trebonia sp. TaxID=2767075 RepID=UPI00260A42A1|nr:hypothetical protein [Trebonia sp.]
MNTVEERIRAATRAVDGAVSRVRPLDLPPAAGTSPGPRPGARVRRARRWRTWLAPVTAAAAVLAIGIALVIVRDIPNGRVVSPARPALPAAVPTYYVALDHPDNRGSPDPVVVGDTRTGTVLATVQPPAHDTFDGVTAAADDRTFILDVRQFTWPDRLPTPPAWYLLRLFPGSAHPARLTRLAIPAVPWPSLLGTTVDGIALSPDGTELAVMFQESGAEALPVRLWIYSVATGKLLRAWTAPVVVSPMDGGALVFGQNFIFDDNTILSWTADGRELAFVFGLQGLTTTTVRVLDLARPGQNLLADSKVVLDLKQGARPDCTTLMPTAGGQTIICGTSPPPGKGAAGGCAGTVAADRPALLEFSTATGQLTGTVYQYTGQCRSGSASVLWANPSGSVVIGYLDIAPLAKTASDRVEAGVITHGRFTPLSFLLAGGTPPPDSIAW